MRYATKDLMNQMIVTLQADSVFSGVTVKRHAGEVNPLLFTNPVYWRGVISKIPFVFVKYQGRTAKVENSTRLLYSHLVDFCVYVATKSMALESGVESCEEAETYLARIFDLWHGKVFNSQNTWAANFVPLAGTQITTAEFREFTPLSESGGTDEKLLWTMPEITVYETHYNVKVLA